MAIKIIYHVSLTEIMFFIENPTKENIAIIKFSQAFQTIGIFVIPAFIAAVFLNNHSFQFLQLQKKPYLISIVLVIFSMIAWIPSINFTAAFNARLNLPESMNSVEEKIQQLRDNYNQLTGLFLESVSIKDFLINILVMALLPAIGEELLFRGVFQRLFTEWTKNIHLGIFIAAFLFSFFHFEFYGFLPRFLLGVLFGYYLAWTSSLWIPIMAHFINNFIIVGYYYFVQPLNEPSAIDQIGTTPDIFLLISIIAGTLLITGLYYIEKLKCKARY
jgi:membrane protease YdiL (CAAX protease family)